MDYQITNKLESPIYRDALSIRMTVFVEEQSVPKEIEIDEHEADCWHIVIYDNDKPVATARILMIDATVAKVQRVAVLKEFRKKHIGRELMQLVVPKAILLGAKVLKVGAQKHAVPFYIKLGYEIIGNEYLEAGIPHYDMIKKIA